MTPLYHPSHVVGDNITPRYLDTAAIMNGKLGEDPEKGHIKWDSRTNRGNTGGRRRSGFPHKHLHSLEHERLREEASSWAQLSPLMAATFGPLSILLSIPSLTQRWHGTVLVPPLLPNGWSNFEALPDPSFNIALSGVTLFCEVMGNFFLILRFSDFHVIVTTWLSYGFWILKIVFAIANYVQFGIAHPQTSTVIYLEGYWVGVCSMAITIIIIVFLTFNLAFLHTQNVDETRRLHHVQREFMIQTLSFFIYLGVVALIFCRVENYTYVQSLYFMVVTFLTIGFGDITPKTTAFKVLTFPFTVTGITLLALIVTSIVRLLADRARRQKAAIKRNQRKRARPNSAKPPPLKRTLTLQEELVKLREEEWIRERRANVTSVVTGLLVFLVFWFIGALIFHLIEPWSYGNALYFCYIFFLTIGYGDFTPTTEAGRPVFIVYALLAVPTITIVVDTVSSNFTAFMVQRVHRIRHQVYEEKDFKIESLTSLVTMAKQKTCETVNTESMKLHRIAERVTENLLQMHFHLGILMAQKLGPDARHVLAAERARHSELESKTLLNGFLQHHNHLGHPRDEIAEHLSEIGKNTRDELELLVEYREFYAAALADLIVVRENLVDLEKDLEVQVDGTLKTKLTKEIEEISG